jgi:tetratricopeptide (TPR) repeat protein
LAEQNDTDCDSSAVKFRDGQILEDLTIASEPFNAWLDELREQAQALRAKVLKGAVVQFCQGGNLAAAIDAAERLCKIDAAREDWQRQLLQLYVKRDGRGPALAYARKWLAALKHDVGVDPEGATLALIEQIRSAEDAGGVPLLKEPGPVGDAASLVPDLPETVSVKPGRDVDAASLAEAAPAGASDAVKMHRSRRPRFWQVSSRPHPWVVTAVGSGIAALFCATLIMVMLLSRTDDLAANANPLIDTNNYVIVRHAPNVAGQPDGQAAQLCDNLGRLLARTPGVKVLSQTAGRSHARASFNLDCGANATRTSIALVLTDNIDGVHVWDADLHVPDQFDSDPLRRAAREIVVGMTQATDRHPGYGANEVTKLIRQARAVQLRGPTSFNHEAAARLYEQALTLDPTSRDASLGVAGELVFTRNNILRDDRPGLERAERLLMRALAEAPNSTAAHFFFGVLQQDFGDYDAALRAFQRALELTPTDPVVSAYVGHVLVLKGDYKAGLSRATSALRISPNDVYAPIWCVFAGEAELELGNVPAATDWFLRAITLSPDYLRAQGWLAAAYSLAGNREAAAPLMASFRRRLQINSMADLNGILRSVPDAGLTGNRPQLLRGLRLAAKASGL